MENEIEAFVARMAAAWATGDSEAFRDLWHPDGVLYHPLLDRVVAGHELSSLHRAQLAAAPDLAWTLLNWTSRGDSVVVEFHNSWTTAGGRRFEWRGVDALRLKDGKIIEERVYADTGPLRAMKDGKAPEPLLRLVKSSSAAEEENRSP
jgi:ketosteroid isomerase-like protein